MASSTSKTTRSRYIARPHLPPASVAVYDVMVRVMSGHASVTEAANELAMARNQFQTCLHKVQRAFIAALPAGRTGRPKKPATHRRAVATIAAQRRVIERLSRDKRILEARLQATSELIRTQMSIPATRKPSTSSRPRSKRSRSSTTTATTASSDDESEAERACALASRLESIGCGRELATRSVGVALATMRRWRAQGPPRRASRARARTCDAATRATVEGFVRASHGRFGCEALRRRVGSVSRRTVATIKAHTLRAMERERKADATRVSISAPGVVRGFDAMHLATLDGSAYALRAQDAAIPFTTSLVVAERYDSPTVARALERDFADHGAPYVMRLDRASVHRTDEIARVLRDHGVLALHGPPRYPCFYGQLERQHGDLRAFAPAGTRRSLGEHASVLEHARVLLNGEWCRRNLNYNTAEQRWNDRVVPTLDRSALRSEVLEIERRIREEKPDLSEDDSRRFAILAALKRHELLRLIPGGYR